MRFCVTPCLCGGCFCFSNEIYIECKYHSNCKRHANAIIVYSPQYIYIGHWTHWPYFLSGIPWSNEKKKYLSSTKIDSFDENNDYIYRQLSYGSFDCWCRNRMTKKKITQFNWKMLNGWIKGTFSEVNHYGFGIHWFFIFSH